MRVSYYPEISRIRGLSADPAPAAEPPSFWSSLGQSVLGLTTTFGAAAAQKALYGQAASVVSTPGGLVAVQGTGTPLKGATTISQLPSWFWPVALLGAGALAYVVLRKR